MGPDNFIKLDAKLGALAAPRPPLAARLWKVLRGRTVFAGAPLLIAFIAAAANTGEPERVLGIIAAIGIAVHIVALRFYRRKLRRSLDKPAANAPAGDPQIRTTLDDLRQWHLAHAYLLGALKLRATDEATRQLAAEAEDAAQGALLLVERMAASGEQNKPDKTADLLKSA